LSTHLRLGVPSGPFASGFPSNIIYTFLFSHHSWYLPCPSHPPWLDHSNYTWKRVRAMKPLIRQRHKNVKVNSAQILFSSYLS
jgi:hypothetical protein